MIDKEIKKIKAQQIVSGEVADTNEDEEVTQMVKNLKQDKEYMGVSYDETLETTRLGIGCLCRFSR